MDIAEAEEQLAFGLKQNERGNLAAPVTCLNYAFAFFAMTGVPQYAAFESLGSPSPLSPRFLRRLLRQLFFGLLQ